MASERIKSLDVFRGLVMACMVLVESPGNWSAFRVLRHANQGSPITPTDFIFPLFIFIMGVAVPLSLSSKLKDGLTAAIVIKILRRTAIMFAIGVFLRLYPHFQFSRLILAGVLQRIAIVYMIISFLYIKLKTKTIITIVPVILLSYWGMLTLIPVEGFTPPGFCREHNIARVIDEIAFGRFRADGIFGTITSAVTGLLGVLSGIVILSPKEKNAKFKTLFLWGAILVVLGLLWGKVFSIEKDLWTSTYTLYTGGVGMMLFAFFYWLIDIKGVNKWTAPFTAYGINCISVYACAHILMYSLWSFTVVRDGQKISWLDNLMANTFDNWFSPPMASLMFSLSVVVMWLIPLYIMYRKKIIIKI